MSRGVVAPKGFFVLTLGYHNPARNSIVAADKNGMALNNRQIAQVRANTGGNRSGSSGQRRLYPRLFQAGKVANHLSLFQVRGVGTQQAHSAVHCRYYQAQRNQGRRGNNGTSHVMPPQGFLYFARGRSGNIQRIDIAVH